ncbi:MAG: hypothetical protein OXI83_16265, partial [Gemmatimonadota bacterium]|nr:hypothetical protein [Gemmatimonadota bacterium]
MRLSRVRGLLLVVAVVVAAVGVGLWASQGSASAQAPLAHETDDVVEPVLVFLGEVPAETRDWVWAEFQRAQAFFEERFGGAPVDYTTFVAADREAATPTYLRLFRNPPGEYECGNSNRSDAVIFILATCSGPLIELFGPFHFVVIRAQLASPASLPPVGGGYRPRGPEWLRFGTGDYVQYAYQEAAGGRTVDWHRRHKAGLARRAMQALSSLAAAEAWDLPSKASTAASALSFVAVHRLLAHAGEPAILAYYRLLPSSGSWEEAFEGAFGIAIDAFYESFEEYRRETIDPPAQNSIIRDLQPGWNLIGWMGPDTSAADLFKAVPALQVIAAWDADAGRYAWVRRGRTAAPALAQVKRGQALFLWVGGTEPVQWARPASVEGMLLTLAPGQRLVGWAGLDGTPITEAVGRFRDALVAVSWWNAETQSYEHYKPGPEGSASAKPSLQHGDALWVELSEEARWWQSGTRRTDFAFLADLSPERESELRDEMEGVLAFFAERYGIEPVEVSVFVDPASGSFAGRDEIWLGVHAEGPSSGGALAHEYFHILQEDFIASAASARHLPRWLIEGVATYAEALFQREWYGETGDKLRAPWWRSSFQYPNAHRILAEPSRPALAYPLGALATDWLVRRAAAVRSNEPFTPLEPADLIARIEDDAYIDFFRLLPTSETWEEAFEKAFGIAINDFYEAFEEYRRARLPHLADAVHEPVLVFEGEIPPDTVVALRAEFEDVLTFFRDRFGVWPIDYTVFVAADAESGAAVYFRMFGEEPYKPLCGVWEDRVGLFAVLTCVESLARSRAHLHALAIQWWLAPVDSLPRASDGHGPYGPAWLQLPTVRYVVHTYNATRGSETLDQIRHEQILLASRAPVPRSDIATGAGMANVPYREAQPRRFLAVDW